VVRPCPRCVYERRQALPASGLQKPWHQICRAVRSSRVALLLLRVPRQMIADRAMPSPITPRCGALGARHLSRKIAGGCYGESRAAVLLRQQSATRLRRGGGSLNGRRLEAPSSALGGTISAGSARRITDLLPEPRLLVCVTEIQAVILRCEDRLSTRQSGIASNGLDSVASRVPVTIDARSRLPSSAIAQSSGKSSSRKVVAAVLRRGCEPAHEERGASDRRRLAEDESPINTTGPDAAIMPNPACADCL